MVKNKNKLNKTNSSGWLDNYSEEFSIGKYVEGGELGSTLETNPYYKEANQFLTDYYNSPRYKEMISNSAIENANYFTDSRLSNLKNTPPLNLPRKDKGLLGGISDSKTGMITIYPRDQENIYTYLHELVHNSDRPLDKGKERLIPKNDNDLINKLLYPNLKSRMSKENWDTYTEDEQIQREKNYKKQTKNYIGTPPEVRARLLEIRKIAKDNNVYDPFTEKVDYEKYQKLLNSEFERLNKNDKGNYPLLDLIEGFDNEGIIQMLNEISQNKEEDLIPMAKNGGEINNNMKKKLKKYPAGGYLTFQEGYKGFGMGPDLYQDNSYFRSVMPDNIEDMEAEINKPSIFSGINDVLGVANQAAGQLTGLMSKFNLPQQGGLTQDLLGGSQGIQLPGAEVLNNLNPTQTQNMMWQQSGPRFVAPQQNGGYLSKYQDGGMTDIMSLGMPEYIHPSNVFREHVIPVPRVHFTEDTSNFDMGVNLNDLVQMNGGKINKYYGGGFAGLYGDSYGNVNQPRVFNSNSNRATQQDLMNANKNDFLNTKVRKDRQSFEDDKVDWGALNFLKEPTGAVLGTLSAVPVVGDITKNALGDSFLTRTGGYTVGKGIGNVGVGTAKVIGGISTGNVGMISSGIGDVGEGVGSTVGTFQAKGALSNYNKSGYISGNRMVNASQDFGNMMDTAGSLFGNIKGGTGMLNNMGGMKGLGSQMKGGKTGMKGFGNFMGSITGFQNGGNINYNNNQQQTGWLDQL